MAEALQFCVPCLFGLEAPLAEELRAMGMKEVRSDNGRVRFQGDFGALAKANLNLRCGERVLVELGSFPAATFDELFEGTKALPWENFIPKDGCFPVKGHSLDSALRSIPDCQRITKKAVSVRLGERYRSPWLPESGENYQIQFSIMKDIATLYLDSSGLGLHKRGYRPAGGDAPIKETLAAGLVSLARYRGQMDFADPFCGSGTLVIEAALTAKNRAPGLGRHFSAEKWVGIPPEVWTLARDEATAAEFPAEPNIFGSDIDPKALDRARQTARRAGVEDIIRFAH
ncbi:MAG: class I SAM-dependent RNA methyltransferase, partial [Firmicutes bacterium]|nr:class I SAM-dependent RNA methyltransferase [Bacillota bacterium]